MLARAVAASRTEYHSGTDWLYALNTFGASAGVLLCAYFLMPTWGVYGAIAVASLLNTAIFLYTLWFTRSHSTPAGQLESFDPATPVNAKAAVAGFSGPASDIALSGSAMRLVLLAAFLTGLITLSYEVIWTHALAFLVGNAVYSFGTMLFTFLCGLAAGAHFVSRHARGSSSWKWLFAASQVLAGLLVLLTLPLWNRVPGLFLVGVKGTLRIDLLALAALILARQAFLVLKQAWRRARPPWFSAHAKEFFAEMLALALLFLLWTQSSPAAFAAGQGLWRFPATYFAATEIFRFLICFFLLIVPAFLLGIAFPVLLNLLNADRRQAGKQVGTVYAANTLGSICGSLLTGFLLLETLGSYATLWLASTLNVALGLLFFALLVPAKPRQKLAVLSVCAAVLAIFALRPSNWSVKDLTTGTYVYFLRQWPVDKVVYAHEDVQGGLTTVVESGNTRTLLTNGKFQGNNTAEIQAQVRFALIPTLFTREFNRALLIGLGTGNSLKALSAFPFGRLDVAEFAPGVIEAARSWFSDVNSDVMDQDPRVRLLVADGRNHLLLSKDRYDLITIEVTSIWINGEADIYNREFYELCRSRLTGQGVLQQWVQVHHMRPRDFQVILNTAAEVFPHVSFFLGPEQGLLVASASPLSVDYLRIAAFDHAPAVREELDIIRRHSLFSVLGELALDDSAYRRLVKDSALSSASGVPVVSSDAFPYLEYQTPKG
ncbi:MAG TPA: fused MFS/spermidine synthase, partial [Candidatus Acidoferrum sp.]|nr:fused MFS/spermidine synthase [Candidatus Acidoferrum sp.]